MSYVEILPTFPEDLRGLDGERAVHEDGHVRRQSAVLRQEVEGIDHLLGPLHGEGGDDHLLSPAIAVGDRLGEFVQAVLFVLMVPIPVGGLHEEEVGLGYHRRILHQKLRRAADVAGKDDPARFAGFRDGQLYHRSAEDMSRILEGHGQPRKRREGRLVFHGGEKGKGGLYVLLGVKGNDVLVPVTEPFPALPLRLHLLNVGAVQQHDPEEILRRRRHVDLAVETLLDKPGEEPRMVHVGVGHQHEFDAGGIVDLDVPIPLFDLGVSLMHAAVDGEPMASGLQDVTGACDRPCRTHKPDFHSRLITIYVFELVHT